MVRDPFTLAITAALGVGSGTLAASLIGIAVNLVVGAVVSWAVAALSPKPGGSAGSREILTNLREAAAPHEYVFGQVRKGGVISYLEATGDSNKYLHMIIVIAGHEVEEIGDVYINDEIVTIDADFVTGDKWKSKIRIKKLLGNQTTADPDLLSESNQIDGNFVGHGIAYLYVRMEYDQGVFANGIPLFTAVIKGAKVYDPRSGLTAYSANASLCTRHYITSDFGLDDPAVDLVSMSVAANVSGENVALAAGGSEARYEINGVVNADSNPGAILQAMMSAQAGTLYWGQGNWHLRPGYYTVPIKTFTLDDLRGPISLDTRISQRDNFNAVRGVFNDAAQDWIEADYPQIGSAAFLSEDNGIENTLDFRLPLTTSSPMGQRLGKLTLFRSREQITFVADFGLAAFDVEPGDIVALTLDRYGWTAKEFEVVGWRFFADQSAGDLRVRLKLRETSAAVFDWWAEETAIISNSTSLLDYRETATVVLGVPSIQMVRYSDGTELPVLLASWTATPQSLAADYVFQWRDNVIDYDANGGFVLEAGLSTQREHDVYNIFVSSLNRVADQDGFDFYVASGLTRVEIEALIVASSENINQAEFSSVVTQTLRTELRFLDFGKRYDLRVLSRNALGVISHTSGTTYLVSADTEAPPVPTYVSAVNSVIGKQTTIRWENPPTYGSGAPVLDRKETEIWRGSVATLTLDGNGDPTNAARVGVSVTDDFIDTSCDFDTTYHYFIRAADYAGNQSAFDAGRQVDTEVATAANSGLTMVLTNEAHSIPADTDGSNPDFSGAITQVQMFVGGVSETGFWSFSRSNGSGVSSSLSGSTLTITGMTNATGYVDITATRSGYSNVKRRFSLSKNPAGADGETPNDGVDGVSVNQITVFKRAASAPSAPSGGSHNFTTHVTTAPSSWSATIPAGSDPLYTSQAVASVVGQTGSASGLTWSTPVLTLQDGLSSKSSFNKQIFKRSATTPATPSGGSYNFGTESFSPPSGWNTNVPSGVNQLWVCSYEFSITGDTGTDSAGTWSVPAKLVKDGNEGSAGTSTYLVQIFRRKSSTPVSPGSGSYNFGTETVTPPTLWFAAPPDGSDPLYVATAIVSIQGTTGSATITNWSGPALLVQHGEDSVSTLHLQAYKRATSTPSTPTGGSYNFDTRVLSPPSTWSVSPPAGSDPLYVTIGVAQIDGGTGTDNTMSWKTPTKMVEDGAPGARGPGDHWISVGSIASANTSGEVDTLFNAGIGAPVENDIATFYTGTATTPTDQIIWLYSGSSWSLVVKRFHGSVIIDESLSAQTLILDGQTVEVGTGGVLQVPDGGITTEKAAPNSMTQYEYDDDLTPVDVFLGDSITAVGLMTFDNDAKGNMEIEWHGTFQIIAPHASDDPADYTVEYTLKSTTEIGTASPVTKTHAAKKIVGENYQQWRFMIPKADLNSREEGNVTLTIELIVNSVSGPSITGSVGIKASDFQGRSVEHKTGN